MMTASKSLANTLSTPMKAYANLNDKDYHEQVKGDILSQIQGMNGQMQEFHQDIENRMGKLFRTKAGKNYGMSEADLILKRSNSKSTFGSLRNAMKEVDA